MTIEFEASLVCSECGADIEYREYKGIYHIAPCTCIINDRQLSCDKITELSTALDTATDLLDECRPLCPEVFI